MMIMLFQNNDVMNLMEPIMAGNGKMTNDILEKLDNTTVNETRQSVLYNLAMSYEALLIIGATQALGDHGIMGKDYPSVISFYQLALRLINAKDTEFEGDSFALDTRAHQHRQRRATYCSNSRATCNQCPYGSGCFGMCGKGCSCWSFVCGDCCVHRYCLTHDDYCNRRGFWSWSCLSAAWRVPQCSQSFRC